MAGTAVLLVQSGSNLWSTSNQQPQPYGAATIPYPDGSTALAAVTAYVAQYQWPVGTVATFADLGTPATYQMEANWVKTA